MISEEQYWRIHHLHRIDGLNAAQIAEALEMSAPTVRKWLRSDRWAPCRQPARESVLEPYKQRIKDLLDHHPYTAVQVFQHLQQETDYQGSYSQVRRYVREIRPKKEKPSMPLKFTPGEAMQVDFGKCGLLSLGTCSRRLSVLVATLTYSRRMYAVFFLSERMEHFLTGVRQALEYFGGVPRKVIVDNCKTAVLHHGHEHDIRFHPRFSEFACHYGFRPVACGVRSPQEKGRVENGVKYVKNNFMEGRSAVSLEQINAACFHWLENVANVRIHGTTRKQPSVVFREEEQAALGSLPSFPADCAVTEQRRVNKFCRVSFQGNRYSVPEQYVKQFVTIKAVPDRVLLYHGETLVAEHSRSYERNTEIVDPEHRGQMRNRRKRAREQNLEHDFLMLGTAAENFLQGLKKQQLNPRLHLHRIMALVDMLGGESVKQALHDAAQFNAFRSEFVEYIATQQPGRTDSTAAALHVPRAGDALEITVNSPDMEQYDQ